jgi:hypothetical protein
LSLLPCSPNSTSVAWRNARATCPGILGLRKWEQMRLRAETDALEDGGSGHDRQVLAIRVNGLPPSVNSDEVRERIAGPFGLANPDKHRP